MNGIVGGENSMQGPGENLEERLIVGPDDVLVVCDWGIDGVQVLRQRLGIQGGPVQA